MLYFSGNALHKIYALNGKGVKEMSMTSALNLTEVSTLSNELLVNLDEGVIFGKLSGYIHQMFGEYKVEIYEVLQDGSTKLTAANGKTIKDGICFAKGEGFSGYVSRIKRAYYSNSKRDPMMSLGKRDDSVQAELCVPLMVDGTMLGTIHIQTEDENRKFSEQDIQNVNELINELQRPLNNLRLYVLAKNLNKELEAKIAAKEVELQSRGAISNNSMQSHQRSVELIGRSAAFINVMNIAKRVASEDFPVCIVGGAGVGKKAIAHKIHELSARTDAPSMVFHCSAISEDALEVELFGEGNRAGALEE
jgi:Nif-specific regulatory protein